MNFANAVSCSVLENGTYLLKFEFGNHFTDEVVTYPDGTKEAFGRVTAEVVVTEGVMNSIRRIGLHGPSLDAWEKIVAKKAFADEVPAQVAA